MSRENQLVALLRREVETLIDDNDSPLAAKFLHLGFHDCNGGCDGCANLFFFALSFGETLFFFALSFGETAFY